jgi:DNA-binding transcriptional MerR regulator
VTLVSGSGALRTMDKSPDAFRTISEVAEDLDLPQHVLRFWETRFAQIKPLKRGGGRRYYRPDDIDLLKGIRQLLYGEGYTIKGVQRILKSDGIRFVQAIGRGERTAEASSADDAAAEIDTDFEEEGFNGAETASRRPEGAGRERPEALSREAVASLKAALDELLECQRVLATLSETPAGSGPEEAS